jgi:nucleotidyltransferase substrate binding protein (TIGR01987 family)
MICRKDLLRMVLFYMKKLDNFSNYLRVLKNADFELADSNEIYRTGVIGQFNLTFELAWKALQAVLRIHGAEGADTGSPREILQLGYKFGFINDSSVWMLMLKKRNLSVNIYNEEDVEEMIVLIRDSFITAFVDLEKVLEKKVEEVDESWES